MRARSDEELRQVRGLVDVGMPDNMSSKPFLSDDAIRLLLLYNSPADIEAVLNVVDEAGCQARAIGKALRTGLRCFNLGKSGEVLP